MLQQETAGLIPAPRSPEPFITSPQAEVVEIHGFADEYVLSCADSEGDLSFFGARRPGHAIIEVGQKAFELSVAEDLTVTIGGLKRTIQAGRFIRDGEPGITLSEATRTGVTAEDGEGCFVVTTSPRLIGFFTDYQGEDVRITTQVGQFEPEY